MCTLFIPLNRENITKSNKNTILYYVIITLYFNISIPLKSVNHAQCYFRCFLAQLLRGILYSMCDTKGKVELRRIGKMIQAERTDIKRGNKEEMEKQDASY